MSAVIYTTRFCPFCVRAKQLFDDKSVSYKEIAVDNDPALRQEMMKKSGRHTVPQIWINDKHIGGCDELYTLQRSGKLDSLL
jgi:glutaredoxin 3